MSIGSVAAIGAGTAARSAEETAESNAMLVRLGGLAYALPAEFVREIVRLPPVTRVPGLPSFVAGLANVRGRVLAVLDLRPLLRLEAPRGDRLVILDAGNARAGSYGSRAIVGLIVDAALDLLHLPDGSLEPLPPGISPDAGAVLDGMTVVDGAPVAVISPPGLLALRDRLSLPA